jgi:hypothetical protein
MLGVKDGCFLTKAFITSAKAFNKKFICMLYIRCKR